MKDIYPVTITEIETNDEYSYIDLSNLKIFIDEFRNDLSEFVALTADGRKLLLSERILEANDLSEFIESK